MAYCKQCLNEYTADCIYSNGICVFCRHNTDKWESNGKIVLQKESKNIAEKSFSSWKNYYKKYYSDLKSAKEKLPKGCIVSKIIKGHKYYYLEYRDGDKIVFKYLGKKEPEKYIKICKIRKDINRNLKRLDSIFVPLGLSKRKFISQSLRFDILKRDNFTCQYCGGKPPKAVLQVDHIKPACE